MSICPGCGRCRVCGSPPSPSPYPYRPVNPFVPYPGTGTAPAPLWPNPNTLTPWQVPKPTITYC
jgi:hypothetical protein